MSGKQRIGRDAAKAALKKFANTRFVETDENLGEACGGRN